MAVNDKLTKTPYKTEKYTEQQLVELAKCANDPKYFMREDVTEQKIFHTRHPTRKKFCGGRPGSPLFCDM